MPPGKAIPAPPGRRRALAAGTGLGKATKNRLFLFGKHQYNAGKRNCQSVSFIKLLLSARLSVLARMTGHGGKLQGQCVQIPQPKSARRTKKSPERDLAPGPCLVGAGDENRTRNLSLGS